MNEKSLVANSSQSSGDNYTLYKECDNSDINAELMELTGEKNLIDILIQASHYRKWVKCCFGQLREETHLQQNNEGESHA